MAQPFWPSMHTYLFVGVSPGLRPEESTGGPEGGRTRKRDV